MNGVYALEFRMERTIVRDSFCTYPAPYPLTSSAYLSTRPTCDTGKRPFRVANNETGFSLWRCAACTRFEPVVAKNGFFQCTLPGRLSMDNLFTQEMLQNTFDFLYYPSKLLEFVRGKIMRYSSEVDDFQVREADGVLHIMMLLKERKKMSNWEASYDPSNTLQSESIIWKKAVRPYTHCPAWSRPNS